ncbi:MAG: TolC family protein [Candidatus Azobacteroides sp.]|nr:TolC family protein [Candidatus Azobacteroides sp.]
MKQMKSLLVFIFLCACTLLSAQSKPWSLEDCIQYAIEHNISIKQLVVQKNVAEVNLNTAQMSRVPNLNAGGGQSWSFGRTQMETGLYETQDQSNTGLSVSSSIPLFTGFRIPNEIAKNKLDLETSVQNLEKAKDDLALNVASLFLQVLFNKELLKINQEQLALSQSQIERTQALTDAGKVPLSQLYDIEAQVANDKVSVVQSENDLRLSLLDLAQSLELQLSADFDILVPEFNDVVTEYMGSVQPPQIVFDNAVKIKPVIKAQELQVKSAEKSLAIAKSAYYPTLSLDLNAGTNYFYLYNSKDKDFSNKSFSNQIKNNMSEAIALNLSIPIFNRFSVRNQVRNARFNIENQQLALENTKKSLYKEIETAYLNAIAAQEKYNSAQQAIKSTSESFNYAKERYETGKSSVFEFNEARTRLIRSRSEEIQAKYDYIFRTKILDFYNGIPIKL